MWFVPSRILTKCTEQSGRIFLSGSRRDLRTSVLPRLRALQGALQGAGRSRRFGAGFLLQRTTAALTENALFGIDSDRLCWKGAIKGGVQCLAMRRNVVNTRSVVESLHCSHPSKKPARHSSDSPKNEQHPFRHLGGQVGLCFDFARLANEQLKPQACSAAGQRRNSL